MIYDTLDNLPVKTFYKIQSSGNAGLLNPNNETTQQDLNELFDDLVTQFEVLSESSTERDFFIKREISHLESVKKIATLGVEILKFEWNEEIRAEVSKLLGLNIRTNRTIYYYKDLERCEKKIALIDKKIQTLSNQLPKEKESNNNTETIDDVLASFCTVLGVSFDFNTLPCTSYIAYKKQMAMKIKTQSEQLSKLKNK